MPVLPSSDEVFEITLALLNKAANVGTRAYAYNVGTQDTDFTCGMLSYQG